MTVSSNKSNSKRAVMVEASLTRLSMQRVVNQLNPKLYQ